MQILRVSLLFLGKASQMQFIYVSSSAIPLIYGNESMIRTAIIALQLFIVHRTHKYHQY